MLNDQLSSFELATPNDNNKFTSSQKVLIGKIITPKQHLLLISANDWEEFITEWGHFKKTQYHLVTRLGGANDYGIDVACFYSDKGFQGQWDNFQCKYYNDPLSPGTAIPEIGKLLWHIYNKKITAPNKYNFFAPKDCGPSLKKLLLDASKLKQKLFDEWENWCAASITSTQSIKLEGDFLNFVQTFDFTIFQYKPLLEVIEDHSKTPYHAIRFGGGLKDRPEPNKPPSTLGDNEARYVEQLHETYAEYRKTELKDFDMLKYPDLQNHFDRQRETFYFAESLKTFARDSVPPGTFEALQSDMLDGVIDTAESHHENGYERLKEVLKGSLSIPLNANGLFQVIRVKDRHGICHQLANENKLTWVKKNV